MSATTLTPDELLAKARGCMLGLMIGDALGMPFEGLPPDEVRDQAAKLWGKPTVEGFVAAVPMGTFCAGPEPATYREARGVRDCNFVPTGVPQNEHVASQCARRGTYTDDTNACLGVASSIVQHGSVDAQHVARCCAELWRDNEMYRGVPPAAKMTLLKILDGASAEEVGLPPHYPFPGGSFANGGGMRISPLAVACRNAEPLELRRLVTSACTATHRHPEAVDFAVVQAAAVAFALKTSPADFDPEAFLSDLTARCETDDLRRMLEGLSGVLADTKGRIREESCANLGRLVDSVRRPGSGMGFQIASVHMAPCVLFSVCRDFADPREALKTAIDLGGDTDTTASMVGAIVGALHGEEWCSDWAAELENGPHGRDFALRLVDGLVALDIRA